MAKFGFVGQKLKFWAQKKKSLLYSNHVMATTEKKIVQGKKLPMPK